MHSNIITELILERLIQKTDKYDLSSSVRRMIVTASALHDIGKIGIDDKILNKPGRLSRWFGVPMISADGIMNVTMEKATRMA